MELLAPAGDVQSLKAAVCAGSNAVYLGLEKLNARIKADNFNTQDLEYWVNYCHLRSVKVYVVINTLIKEQELNDAVELLKACNNAHVDALIIQDLALTELAMIYAPKCQLHASTQLGIHNLEGALAAKKLGFSRVVLSRETTLQDIKEIKKHTDLELECFIHGALCVAFSGNCYFSSTLTGCSGNRGQCLQFCRKKYTNTINGKTAYWLSTKDQCLLSVIEELKLLGIDSLKIEGRLRSSEYVFSAVTAYRKVLDGEKLNETDLYRLKTTFNRGNYTKGYAFNDDIMYPEIQSNIGYKIGKIIKSEIEGRNYILTIDNKIPLNDAMSCKIINNGKEVGGFNINSIANNKIVTDKDYKGDLHITSDKSIKKLICDLKITCDFILKAKIGEALVLTAKAIDTEAIATSDYIVEQSRNARCEQTRIIENISKLGSSDYKVGNVIIDMDDDAYIPLSAVNALRRFVIEKLTIDILKDYNTNNNAALQSRFNLFKSTDIKRIIMITNAVKFFKIEAEWLNRVEVVVNIPDYSIIRQNMTNSKIIYIKLPIYAPFENLKIIKEFLCDNKNDNIGIYVENLYALELALQFNLPIIIGATMNVTNRIANKLFNGNACCLSSELKSVEIFTDKAYLYAYGHLPLMTLAHCPIKVLTNSNCANCNYAPFEYYDEYGKFYVIRERLKQCVFTLYNGTVHNLTDVECYGKILDFTILDDIDPNIVLECAFKNKKLNLINSTRGNYKRGVN